MLLVERTGPGAVGLNYMWLPTWIGLNAELIRDIEKAVSARVVGRELTEATLKTAHQAVLDYLVGRFPEQEGLFDYLDGIKYIQIHGQAEEKGPPSHPGA